MLLILFAALLLPRMLKHLYKAFLIALHINHKTINLIAAE